GTRPCEQCGTVTLRCENGVWLEPDDDACLAQGPCAPGATQPCGTGGTQRCGDDCQWSECTCPADLLTCGSCVCASPGDVAPCGSCTNDCAALPHVVHGSAACDAKGCTYECVGGFADCRKARDGCT